MKDTINKKVALIFSIATLLWIASCFIRTLSDERRGRRAEVLQEISSGLTSDQTLGTPFLEVAFGEASFDGSGQPENTERGAKHVQAARASFEGNAKVEPRSRGIFHAQSFGLHWVGKVRFEMPTESEIRPAPIYNKGSVYSKGVRLVLPFANRKGLTHHPVVKINGWNAVLVPEACGTNLCYDLGGKYEDVAKAIHEVDLDLELTGVDQIAFGAGAEENSYKLASNWPSPSFQGSILPTARSVSDQGFSAEWNVIGTKDENHDSSFSVRFVEPVDVYTLSDRATKYAILFILCVFGGFFLVEIAAKLRLHPLQYGLVGAALVIFYLLVLSLAEHMRFGLAYGISAAASVALITFYLVGALREKKRAGLMGAVLAALYGMLFVIISAEDYALLFGSGLAFTVLAAIMITTRKLDWYQLDLGNSSPDVRT